jgi:esterase/lipase
VKTTKGVRRTGVALGALVLLLLLVGVVPWTPGLSAISVAMVEDYSTAVQQIDARQDTERADLKSMCVTQLLTHGQKTARVIVLVHGFTNCPQQFLSLGSGFYRQGYNVLIAPLPHHGLQDRMTDEQSLLSAGELITYANATLNLAHGLGDDVTMAGISGGGVVTAWAAQFRPDLDVAMPISPAFGFKQIPTPLTAGVMNLYSVLPDRYEWWDPAQQAHTGPEYAYPQYSMHALMQFVRLGYAVQNQSRVRAPAAKRIIVVTNGSEPSVNNVLTELAAAAWERHGANIVGYEFPAAWQLPHDMIDPNQEGQKTDQVYQQLIDLLGQ